MTEVPEGQSEPCEFMGKPCWSFQERKWMREEKQQDSKSRNMTEEED